MGVYLEAIWDGVENSFTSRLSLTHPGPQASNYFNYGMGPWKTSAAEGRDWTWSSWEPSDSSKTPCLNAPLKNKDKSYFYFFLQKGSWDPGGSVVESACRWGNGYLVQEDSMCHRVIKPACSHKSSPHSPQLESPRRALKETQHSQK